MKCRRLMQQYAVDMFAKIEGARIQFVKHNQRQIRADKYCGLMDAQANDDLANAGTKIILRPTVYGSPRFYSEAFQNSMAVVRKLGKPDIFITFTCNPRWQEIKDALHPGESPGDRPDLCARVFKMKLDQLIKDLTVNHILGETIGDTYTIEFQKRGLPHCHILLTMKEEYKPRTPEIVDTIVCAEIPDKEQNPQLYDIITNNVGTIICEGKKFCFFLITTIAFIS